MVKDITTITLEKRTYDELAEIGKKSETFSQTVHFLIDVYNYYCEVNNLNRKWLDLMMIAYNEQKESEKPQ